MTIDIRKTLTATASALLLLAAIGCSAQTTPTEQAPATETTSQAPTAEEGTMEAAPAPAQDEAAGEEAVPAQGGETQQN